MRHYILVIMLAVCAAVSAQNDRQLIREGNRLYRQKQYAQAEVLYRKAIAKKADNPQAVYNLGCALMMQQKDSAAIVQYENATKLEKNKLRQSKSWHNIGVMCQSHKMYGEAVRAYEQSLRLNPSDDETRYNLALCKQLNKNNPQQDKNQQDKKNGFTAPINAVFRNKDDMVKFLLESGADRTISSYERKRAEDYARDNRNMKILSLLTGKGCGENGGSGV